MKRVEVIEAYFNFCKQAGYEPEQVVLSAGAALVMFEEREDTNDLDCDIPPHDFAQFVCQMPSKHFKSSMGEYYEYDDKVSLHPACEGVGISQHATPKGLVYTYSWMSMVEQKIRLLEMPDRNPEKIPQDIADLDEMVLGLVFAGGDAGVKAMIERAGRAKAARL